MNIRFTLISDGSSDRTLLHIVRWLMNDLYPNVTIETEYADFRVFVNIPKTFAEKIKVAKVYYPYDVLLIHRDAERNTKDIIEIRSNEIKEDLSLEDQQNLVCIVPVKMMESWLLFDVEAIKLAAGNRHYPKEIKLPSYKTMESYNQPKDFLHRTLREVSGLTKRRLQNFNAHKSVHDLADFIEDYSPLRSLNSFKEFEKSFLSVCQPLGVGDNA